MIYSEKYQEKLKKEIHLLKLKKEFTDRLIELEKCNIEIKTRLKEINNEIESL